jgi:flagellum-specific ATP synthase
VVDAVRSLLDGHILLDRGLATRGHYPPVAVLDSLSRLMPSIVSTEHLKKAAELRGLLAAYARSEDLIRIGAYQPGSDPVLDRAIEVLPQLETYLRQGSKDSCSFDEAVRLLLALPS